MWKTFYNRFRNPVFMCQYALTTKAMILALRLWAGTVFIYFCPDRAFYAVFFHHYAS